VRAGVMYGAVDTLAAQVQQQNLQVSIRHGNTLHRTATHGDTRRHTATHCNTLQHTVTHYNTLQRSGCTLCRANEASSVRVW